MTESRMGTCYSGGYNAQDHRYADIITGNIEEPQKKSCRGTVSDRFHGGKGA